MRKSFLGMFWIIILSVSILLAGFLIQPQENMNMAKIGFGLGPSSGFSLQTVFPDAPVTLSYYRVLGQDQFENGTCSLGSDEVCVTEDEAILIAQDYLESRNLLPEDAVLYGAQTIIGGNAVEKTPHTISVAYTREINGLPVVGPGDSIYVLIEDKGNVAFCFKRWRDIDQVGEINVIDAEEGYNKLLEGEIINKKSLSNDHTFEIYNISLGYYSMMASETQKFYKPIWIFYGEIDGWNTYLAVEAAK